MPLHLLALAVAPGIAIAIYIFYSDKFEREPLHLLVKCFLLGCLATMPSLFLGLQFSGMGPEFHDWVPKPVFDAFIVAGAIEEYAKFAVLYFYAYPKRDFNEPYDGITYSVMVSMGFATLENILYVAQGGVELALLRMLTAIPAHATFGILMGYFVGLAKFRPQRRARLLLTAYLVAFLFHGAYDYFLLQRAYQFLALGAIASLLLGIILSARAIRIHRSISPFRPDAAPEEADAFH